MKPGTVVLRPWRSGDRQLLLAASGELSPATLQLRFRTGTPSLPPSYLTLVDARWPTTWDGVVAVRDGSLLGWADFGREANQPWYADVAVCLVDAEQGHGLGTALIAAVVGRARAAGVNVVHADIAASNPRAGRAWVAATGRRDHTVRIADPVSRLREPQSERAC